ncbi:hypothetical protein EON63_10035, partial [archaeon]
MFVDMCACVCFSVHVCVYVCVNVYQYMCMHQYVYAHMHLLYPLYVHHLSRLQHLLQHIEHDSRQGGDRRG